jgi:hypothetical protein
MCVQLRRLGYIENKAWIIPVWPGFGSPAYARTR